MPRRQILMLMLLLIGLTSEVAAQWLSNYYQ
jgi:hypothetical protein